MTIGSIQEGGCTTQPPIHRALIRQRNMLHAAAALSPAGVVGVAWAATLLGDPGSPARAPVFSGVVLCMALLLAIAALLRARTRTQRALALIGVVGNVILLAFGLLGPPIFGGV